MANMGSHGKGSLLVGFGIGDRSSSFRSDRNFTVLLTLTVVVVLHFVILLVPGTVPGVFCTLRPKETRNIKGNNSGHRQRHEAHRGRSESALAAPRFAGVIIIIIVRITEQPRRWGSLFDSPVARKTFDTPESVYHILLILYYYYLLLLLLFKEKSERI